MSRAEAMGVRRAGEERSAQVLEFPSQSALIAAAVWCALLTGCSESHARDGMSQSEPFGGLRAAGSTQDAGTDAAAPPYESPPNSPPNSQPQANPNVPAQPPAPAPADVQTAAACDSLPSAIAKRWIAFDSDREAYNRDLYLIMGDGSHLTRLTTSPATEKEPAFAPDGQHLAYASDVSGTTQIYLLDLGDGSSTQLTQKPEGADQPSWSSDGKRLVFHSLASVFIIDADGTHEQLIATGDNAFNAFKYPSLSPDGATVVFDRNNEIDALSLDGTGQRWVVKNTTTIEEMPTVSPDGYSVAYAVRCGTDERIEVVRFADSTDACAGTVATPSDGSSARRPAWGPDDYLAYERTPMSDPGIDGTHIAITAGPGEDACDVAGGPWESHNPSWAPEGFSPSDALGAAPVEPGADVTPVPSAMSGCGTLGDDIAQRWLAFDSDREAYNRDLYIVRVDGSDLTRLTTEESTEEQPAFAPDGKHLAYVSDASGTKQIYLRDLADGRSTQLTQRSEGADEPSWSSAGDKLVFHSGQSVYIIDADGTNEHEILSDGEGVGFEYPTLSPDGTHVVFDRDNEIDAANIDGSGKRYVVQNWTTTEEMPAILSDGYNVAYAVSCDSVERIAVVPFAGYAANPCMVTFATKPDQGAARHPAWGPNNLLVYEHALGAGQGDEAPRYRSPRVRAARLATSWAGRGKTTIRPGRRRVSNPSSRSCSRPRQG